MQIERWASPLAQEQEDYMSAYIQKMETKQKQHAFPVDTNLEPTNWFLPRRIAVHT